MMHKKLALTSLVTMTLFITVNAGSMFPEKLTYHDNKFNPDNTVIDVMRFAPAGLMYTMKVLDIKSRSSWKEMVVTNGIAGVITCGSTWALKHAICRERPDGSDSRSFPSGHAALAFMTATMLHKEYGETCNPWFSVVGYGTASTVCMSRIYNNNHWCTDVLLGAGIGVFSTELAYYLSGEIFNKKHLSIFSLLPQKNGYKWNFGVSSSFHFNTDFSNYTYQQIVRPTYTMQLSACRMFTDWFGARFSAGFTQLQMTPYGNTLYLCDDITDIKDISTGCYIDIPIIRRLSTIGSIDLGKTFGCTKNFFVADQSQALELPDALRISCNFGFSIRSSDSSKIGAYVGADRYSDVWLSYSVGTSFSFTF